MKNIFILRRVSIKSETGAIRHPYNPAVEKTLGRYWSLDSAIAAMREFVATQDNRCTYCFYITECDFEPKHIENVTERCYTKQGELYEHYLKSLDAYFRGRNPKDIRFKEGDIVEVFKWDGVYLEIITGTPMTKELYRQRCNGSRWYAYANLGSDDVYTTHSLIDLRENDHPHSHPYPIMVFPLSKPISAKHRKEFVALFPECFGDIQSNI